MNIQIWDAINDGTIYSCPSLLSSFSAIFFANLKKYHFSYHFAYPALHSDPQWKRVDPISERTLTPTATEDLVDKVQTWKYSVDPRQHGFFLAKKIRCDDDQKEEMTWSIAALSEIEHGFFDNIDERHRYVCFVDPSTYPENPGWMLRNLLVLVRQRFKLPKVQILCYRDTHSRRESPTSIILTLQCGTENTPLVPSDQFPKVTGWERNEHGKLSHRTVDLASYLDPARLADQAVDLNLKLIKWRIAPLIDLDIIKNTSCLLLGAGTLGSYVARNLMGWGVRKITFVDNARVSYSNPVRQPLYNFEDCQNGGAKKAERAAEALRQIYPGVEAEGVVMSVPMAGHPITNETAVRQDYEKLHDLISSHDAVFLLMDTRESRWLPTVIGKSLGKIVINAALGFDTYMVMRHGVKISSVSGESSTAEELGCYFCSDVVAPKDSLKSATLDQQCTVTRPGVAPIASALAVEILVSVLQSPLKAAAPAPAITSASKEVTQQQSSAEPTHPLGTIPHQLRGFLSAWQTMTIKGQAYDCCSACSPSIIEKYEKDGWEFVKRCISEAGYVEEISGLAEVQRRAEEADKDVDWEEEDESTDRLEDLDQEGELL